MEFNSGDFQCPYSGWGVYFIFDEDKEIIRAEVCDIGIWDVDKCEPEMLKDTQDWCDRFGVRPCDTLDEARKVAHEYDTFF